MLGFNLKHAKKEPLLKILLPVVSGSDMKGGISSVLYLTSKCVCSAVTRLYSFICGMFLWKDFGECDGKVLQLLQ